MPNQQNTFKLRTYEKLNNGKLVAVTLTYSHSKQLPESGLNRYSYMWKHMPTGKVGRKSIWVSSVENLHRYCNAMNKTANEMSFYLPLDYSNS